MISTVLSLWGKGAVTLPKAWRERFHTKHFLVEEQLDGRLMITPVQTDVVWYDNKHDPEDGHMYSGISFPGGMPMADAYKRMQKAMDNIQAGEKKKRKRKPSSR